MKPISSSDLAALKARVSAYGLRAVIPYVMQLTFPTDKVRYRRDHDWFLTQIEASALLHRSERCMKVSDYGAPYVEANLEDYRVAYDQLRRVLGPLGGVLHPDELEHLVGQPA